ncbi:hypothetical protein QBC44DRAFT_370658 [Cladorrhinum sp. PSN332]|nr:hypothetical protein QBC44DRAFT_370658 [Cladorrhinum sp. PSN332]
MSSRNPPFQRGRESATLMAQIAVLQMQKEQLDEENDRLQDSVINARRQNERLVKERDNLDSQNLDLMSRLSLAHNKLETILGLIGQVLLDKIAGTEDPPQGFLDRVRPILIHVEQHMQTISRHVRDAMRLVDYSTFKHGVSKLKFTNDTPSLLSKYKILVHSPPTNSHKRNNNSTNNPQSHTPSRIIAMSSSLATSNLQPLEDRIKALEAQKTHQKGTISLQSLTVDLQNEKITGLAKRIDTLEEESLSLHDRLVRAHAELQKAITHLRTLRDSIPPGDSAALSAAGVRAARHWLWTIRINVEDARRIVAFQEDLGTSSGTHG